MSKRLQKTALLLAAILSVILSPSCTLKEALIHFDAVAASCTEAGNIEFWQNEAGECFSDEKAEQPFDPTMPALGHRYRPMETVVTDCTEPGKKIYQCDRCGDFTEEEIAPTEHRFYTERVLKPVTCTEDGEEIRVCSVCKAEEKMIVPPTGHDFRTDNICSVCSFEIIPTEGLVYYETNAEGGLGYTVSGGGVTAKDVVIAKYYRGFPIIGLERNAFLEQTALQSITCFADLDYIGQSAFRNCTSLESVAVPDSVRSIGAYAFYACSSMMQLHLGSGVKEIGKFAFFGCYAMKEITAAKDNSVYRAEGNCLMRSGTLILGSNGAQIPACATEIADYAFYEMENLKTVTLPVGMKKIGAAAFSGCMGLCEIVYGGTTAQWKVIELGKDWCKRVSAQTVRCLDGEVNLK